MGKFKHKYLIESTRLRNWDYGANGLYFITICTKRRFHFFGRIVGGEMSLSQEGEAASNCWLAIPDHFQHTELGAFQVMPDHIHGIIAINDPENYRRWIVPYSEPAGPQAGEIGHALPQPDAQDGIGSKIYKPHPRYGNQGSNTVSSMVGSFKAAVTREVRLFNAAFGWQARFHDHIIRSAEELERITRYIRNNPAKWNEDKNNV